jgi:dihydroxyacid dehydratase/phosphogluconate dehydratase
LSQTALEGVEVAKLNRRSQLITAGVARSPNRAMLRAVGFKDGDFEKPIVGVANGHSTMNPCNAGIQPLVDHVMAALKESGAMPQVFGFPTVTDGIGMGTEGMKYSLVSREVIADAIEVAVNGQRMDGVVAVGGCDKNMPGSVMAMARMNVPGIFVYAGTIKPGFWKGEKLTIVSPFEAVGAFTAGRMSQEDFDGIEKNACPSVGACGGQYTANTMSSSFEALGMSLLGSSQMASPDSEKADSAAESARVLLTDGRFSGGTWGMVVGHVAPEAYEGGVIALVKEDDSITIDAKKRVIQLNVPAKELVRRKKLWKAPKPRYSTGVLAKYIKLVSTASRGAITD